MNEDPINYNDLDDESNWKWGIFYYNKKDKRIFPPKRNKFLGWTVNFANPLSILILIIIIASMLLLTRYN
ncbi:MAG: DUF5808 domain-containing protein [Bacteroidia bacterium]